MGKKPDETLMKKNEHTHCLICNSEKLNKLIGYEKDNLVKCKSCGFVFCKQIPSLQELNTHYEGYPRNNYNSPITIKRYNELLDLFEPYRETNKILDIGCGDGYFLEVANKRGWIVYGTEFTETALNSCIKKGIKMNKGILKASNYPEAIFDIVTSFEVIEHINNPQDEVNEIKKILRKNGLFYFTTPNFNSLSRSILKDDWNVIEYPEHLSYYTCSTINRLLKSNGFLKKKIETTGINFSRLNAGINKKETTTTNNENIEELRKKTESKIIFKFLKKIVNSILDYSKKGDTIKGWYIRS